MKTLDTVLAKVPLFEGIDPKYLELMAGCAANVRFEAGEWIYHLGDPAEKFYLIRHGRVASEISVPQRGAVQVRTFKEGDLLGWSWMVPPYRRQMDARALQLTRAIALDGACLRGKFDQDPRLGYELMRRFARVMAQSLAAVRLQLLDVYGNAH